MLGNSEDEILSYILYNVSLFVSMVCQDKIIRAETISS